MVGVGGHTHTNPSCLRVQHGACVNAMDLWQFTPLHEAASKNRVEVKHTQNSLQPITAHPGSQHLQDTIHQQNFQDGKTEDLHFN